MNSWSLAFLFISIGMMGFYLLGVYLWDRSLPHFTPKVVARLRRQVLADRCPEGAPGIRHRWKLSRRFNEGSVVLAWWHCSKCGSEYGPTLS